MKRTVIFICMLCMSIGIFAQATDLVIDNQTPGWLSSKINYGDQMTVRNLKVTGYLNATDIAFIGSLIQERNLDGNLDLSDVDMVEGKNENVLGTLGVTVKDSLRSYRIPKSVIALKSCATNLYIDTLHYDCQCKFIANDCIDATGIGYLIIGDKTDSIPQSAFYNSHSLKKIHFPTSIKYIGHDAFNGSGLIDCNFNELLNLVHLEGSLYNPNASQYTFGNVYTPDTIIVPSLLDTFALGAIKLKEGVHIFIDSNIKDIEGTPSASFAKSNNYIPSFAILHIDNPTPPSLHNNPLGNNSTSHSIKIIVPHGFSDVYRNSDCWRYCNIIEESPFRVRLIDDSIWVVKGTLGGKNRDDIVLGGVFSVGLLKNGKILYLKHEK